MDSRQPNPRATEPGAEDKSRWDAFLSHASEDKAEVAAPLYEALTKRGVRVWYDKAELRIGDRLRQKIDQGLAMSRYGIVVLSRDFFAKDWPQAELDGLASLEVDGRKVILPVWHGLTVQDVRERSPLLAGRMAAKTADGMDAVLDELLTEITGQLSEPPPSLRAAEPQIGSAGIGQSRAIRDAIRTSRARDARRLIDDAVDQLKGAMDHDLTTASTYDPGGMLRFAEGIEPIMGTIAALICEVAEWDRPSLPTAIKQIYRPAEGRILRSAWFAWNEVPTWVVWWLQTTLLGYLAWRDDWDAIGLLAMQSWVGLNSEYRPSTALTPTDAGQAIGVARYGPSHEQQYRDMLPVMDLARTIRKIGYFKTEHPHFIDADDMPYRPLAIGLFLMSLRCVQLGESNPVQAWNYMGGHVSLFVRRLEIDLALQRELATGLFEVSVEDFQNNFNRWVDGAVPGVTLRGFPLGGPKAYFERLLKQP